MSLKVVLKRGEPLLIGTTKVRVMIDSACLVLIDGDGPVLRLEDSIEPDAATTTLEKLHLALQTLYLEGESGDAAARFDDLVARLRRERPDLKAFADELARLRANGQSYKAVRRVSQLSKMEAALPPPMAGDDD